MPTSTLDIFSNHVSRLAEIVRIARKNSFGIESHAFYAPRARAAIVGIRKEFLVLRRNFPSERYPGIAIQLSSIEPLVSKLVEIFPSDKTGMARLLSELSLKIQSDLAAELEISEANQAGAVKVPFMPEEIIEDRHGVIKKILWEVNRCFEADAYLSLIHI